MNQSPRIQTSYNRATRMWSAHYVDSIGQLGEAQHKATRDAAVFALGFQMGRHPQRFARPFSEYKMFTT